MVQGRWSNNKMGFTIKHVHSAKIIPRKKVNCQATEIVDVLDSGAWTGEKCFIIGGGPSLTGMNLSSLSGNKVISINKAYLLYPKSDINYAMDVTFYDKLLHSTLPEWTTIRQRWLRYSGMKLFFRTHGTHQFDPTVHYVKSIERKLISMDLHAGIYGGTNSGFGALMLAIALGCTRIGLLGYDMSIDASEGATHWHEGYSNQDSANLPRKLEVFSDSFAEFSPAIEQLGVNITNLNPDSHMECFPKGSLSDFIG